MKKSDKIAGIISVVIIILTVVYVFSGKLINVADDRMLYVVGVLVGVTFFVIISHYFIIGFILKNRVTAFKELAKKYSLEHSFVNNSFFIPYGKVNSLRGSVNNHTIEISDESFTAETDKLVKDIAISSLVTYTPRKSYNMDTKIYLDGKNVTPDYSQKWIMYRNPFMQIKEIKEYLSKL